MDERQGKTSASNAPYDALCEGRHLAQKGIPEEKSDDSEFGDNLHLALKGEDVELDSFQRSILSKAKKIEQDVLDKIFGEGVVKREDAIREKRFWSPLNEHSGQVDALWVHKNIAVIGDLKSLRGEVSESSKNLQLRDLAVLIWNDKGNFKKIDKVFVYVNQPLITLNPEITVYFHSNLLTATSEVVRRVIKSNDPNSPRVAGEKQCKFCRAKAICKEHQEWIMNQTNKIIQVADKPLAVREQKIEYYHKAKPILAMLKRFVESMEKDIKANPDNYPEFIVETTPGNREITDPQKAYEAVQDVMTLEDYLSLLKVPVGELEKRFSKALQASNKILGIKQTLEEAEKEFDSRLAPFITRGTKTTIKPVKKVEDA